MTLEERNKIICSTFRTDNGKKALQFLASRYADDPITTSDPIEMARALGRRDVVMDLLAIIEENTNA